MEAIARKSTTAGRAKEADKKKNGGSCVVMERSVRALPFLSNSVADEVTRDLAKLEQMNAVRSASAAKSSKLIWRMRNNVHKALNDPLNDDFSVEQGQKLMDALADLSRAQDSQIAADTMPTVEIPEGETRIGVVVPFFGRKGEDWVTWRRQFEVTCAGNNWDAQRRREEAVLAMRGWARTAVIAMADSHPRYGTITDPALLLDAYGEELEAEEDPYWLCKQTKNQTVNKWYREIIAINVREGEKRDEALVMIDAGVTYQFVRGLKRELRPAVIATIPGHYPLCYGVTMEAALKMAEKAEMDQALEDDQASGLFDRVHEDNGVCAPSSTPAPLPLPVPSEQSEAASRFRGLTIKDIRAQTELKKYSPAGSIHWSEN